MASKNAPYTENNFAPSRDKKMAIAKRAKEAMVNMKKGNSRIGDVKELYKDLASD